MAISKDNDRLTIIISKDNKNKLSELAKKDGRSLSNYIVRVLEDHLSKKEEGISLSKLESIEDSISKLRPF